MGERVSIAIVTLGILLAACGSKRTRCAVDTDCPVGATCAGGDCAGAPCAADRDCALGAVCDGAACTPGCRNRLDCPASEPLCEGAAGGVGACVGCLAAADCPAGHECVARACRQPCRDDLDCTSGHCDPDSRWCVACGRDEHCARGEVCVDQACVAGCGEDRDCPLERPRCEPDRGAHGVCVQCRGDADCGAGVCRQDGTCGAPTAIDAGPSAGSRSLDVLFVIDNSADMFEEQDALVAAFPAFIAELEARVGTRPDLHVGVVSTDMGGGVLSCSERGDDGRLQSTARSTACTPPGGAFLRDVAAPSGRDVNYLGTLGEAFACIAPLGVDGCFVEQPIAAAARALDGTVAGNAGFLRSDAALLIVMLSNEDDCSAPSTLFDDALGTPVDSFRCFEHGIQCSPDVPRATGTKTGCVPRISSTYFATPESHAATIRQRKPDGRIAVGVIAGPVAPVTVALGTLEIELGSSCAVTGDLEADPAIRLAAFSAAFGSRGIFSSACAGYEPPLRQLAQVAAGMLD